LVSLQEEGVANGEFVFGLMHWRICLHSHVN